MLLLLFSLVFGKICTPGSFASTITTIKMNFYNIQYIYNASTKVLLKYGEKVNLLHENAFRLDKIIMEINNDGFKVDIDEQVCTTEKDIKSNGGIIGFYPRTKRAGNYLYGDIEINNQCKATKLSDIYDLTVKNTNQESLILQNQNILLDCKGGLLTDFGSEFELKKIKSTLMTDTQILIKMENGKLIETFSFDIKKNMLKSNLKEIPNVYMGSKLLNFKESRSCFKKHESLPYITGTLSSRKFLKAANYLFGTDTDYMFLKDDLLHLFTQNTWKSYSFNSDILKKDVRPFAIKKIHSTFVFSYQNDEFLYFFKDAPFVFCEMKMKMYNGYLIPANFKTVDGAAVSIISKNLILRKNEDIWGFSNSIDQKSFVFFNNYVWYLGESYADAKDVLSSLGYSLIKPTCNK